MKYEKKEDLYTKTCACMGDMQYAAVEGAINMLDVYMSMIDGTIIEIRYCDN